MKKIVLTVLITFCSLMSMAQLDKWKFGIKLAPTVNVATVKDNDPTPSQLNAPHPGFINPSDGYTIKEGNKGGLFFAFTAEYMFNDNFSFLTGLWFTQKKYYVRNYDGGGVYPSYPNYPYGSGYWYFNNYSYSYTGTSVYSSTYWQLPITFKYTSNELFKNFRLYGTFGPTIDIKTSEKLEGGDYAHYWNMANMRTDLDPWRGRNAEGKKVALFNPIDVTLFLSLGATYEVIENLDVFGGLMLNKGFINAVNPKLKFAEPNQTQVNDDQTWKSFLIGFEMGAAYRFTK